MQCQQCGGQNVQVSFVQTGGKSGHQGTGFGGNMNNMARGLTAITTLGTSNLVWKKSKGGSKHKFKNEKMALCQGCGASWPTK